MEVTVETTKMTTIESSIPIEPDIMLKRLLELKNMYEVQRKELGLPNGRGRPDNHSSDESYEDGQDEDESERKRRKLSSLRERHFNPTIPSPQQIQSLIRTIVLKHGNSCHIETIVEDVMMKWQREKLLKNDGSHHGHSDCKKIVQNTFRARSNNSHVFLKDAENEGCWSVAPDEETGKQEVKFTSLAEIISEAIEEAGGLCYLDNIYSYVKENWKNAPVGEYAMNDAEKEHQILVTLSTNPKFYEDEENTDYFQITSRKKKNKDTMDRRQNGGSRSKKLQQQNLSEDEFSPTRTRNPRRAVRDEGPPANVTCRCGATEPGRGAKWKRGPIGDFLCANCVEEMNKKSACPVCGKMYKRTNEDEHDSAWIRCDDCHRWVMNSCDPIDDLSLFDDSNPNHLHYSCPVCREQDLGIAGGADGAGNGDSRENKPAEPKPPVYSKMDVSSEGPDAHKLEGAERECIEKISEGLDQELLAMEDEELRERIEQHENTFADELSQYITNLYGKRDRERYKSQVELERQIKRMRDEKEKKDEMMEFDLIQELKAWFRKEKKESDRKRDKILKSKSRLKDNLLN
eukprot:TRINITY_DN5772_c1_g1_i1.p1 TRINITY_DN5772_c1_g1~~TRINITY_DN5772_c1_g1_i1.p1  ORF type:complete len:574 (-),score=145.25 TRINITY_DN5772_c1_g1_i1:19-1740(-)